MRKTAKNGAITRPRRNRCNGDETMSCPFLLNVAAMLAVLTVIGGLLAFFIDQRTGVGMEAVGWLGIWVTGTLAERYDAPRPPNSGGTRK